MAYSKIVGGGKIFNEIDQKPLKFEIQTLLRNLCSKSRWIPIRPNSNDPFLIVKITRSKEALNADHIFLKGKT